MTGMYKTNRKLNTKPMYVNDEAPMTVMKNSNKKSITLWAVFLYGCNITTNPAIRKLRHASLTDKGKSATDTLLGEYVGCNKGNGVSEVNGKTTKLR